MNEIDEAMKHVRPAKTYPPFGMESIDDETLARMEKHPEQFMTMTCATIDLVDQERFERDRMEAWCIAQPLEVDQRHGIGISIRRAPPGHWELAVSYIYIGKSSVLEIVRHPDGFGVYRWIHEPPLMCAKTLDEAKEWGVEYCKRLCEITGRLLQLTELVAQGHKPATGRTSLDEWAGNLLNELRANAPLDEQALKLTAQLARCDAEETKRPTAEIEEANWWNRWFRRTGGRAVG